MTRDLEPEGPQTGPTRRLPRAQQDAMMERFRARAAGVGTVLGDRYEVVREIGRGGMGRILEARDRVLDRTVALKVLLAEKGAKSQARFLEEAQITGQLTHPNIVSLHELGREGDEIFLAMKLVVGRDLDELIGKLESGDPETVKAWPLRRRLRLFLGVCEAMAYAHERGVIHRDLKPANIMVGRHTDEAFVMDWGLAKPVGHRMGETDEPETLSAPIKTMARSPTLRGDVEAVDLTSRGYVVGTPAYMAPEQAFGTRDLDKQSDVWSLGAILQEFVTLKPPYDGSALEVLQAVAKGPPDPPSVRTPELEVDPCVEAIIVHALAYDRHDRYPSARALAGDIAAFLDEAPVGAYGSTARERLGDALRRHRAALIVSAVAFVVINVLWPIAAVRLQRAGRDAEDRLREAQSEMREARANAATARMASALVEATGAAADRIGDATRRSVDLEAIVDRVPPVDELIAEHAAARSAIDEHATAIGAAFAGIESGARLEPGAPFEAAIAAVRARLDLILARALVARAPRRALQVFAALDLGEERVLFEARAHLRRGDERRARRALEEASFSDERTDLDWAAAALLARVNREAISDQLEALDRAVEESQPRAWLHLRRAEARVLAGDLDGAMADWARAAALDPADPWVHLSPLRGSTPRSASPVVVAGQANLVRRLTAEPLPWRATHDRVRLWRGLLSLEALSARLADGVAGGSLTASEAAREGAVAALAASDLVVADRFVREAVVAAPGDAEPLGLAAELHLRKGDLSAADEVARRGLVLHAEEPRCLFVLGEVARRGGRLDEALAWLRAAARGSLDPGRWEHLARALVERGDPASLEEGLDAARRALALDPLGEPTTGSVAPLVGDPAIHRTIARLHRARGDLGRAALHAVRALACAERLEGRLGRDRRDAITAGELHEAMGLPDEARALYRLALDDPERSDEAQRRIRALGGGD